jgi:sugar/nucleoside kinase (ribokinase family)
LAAASAAFVNGFAFDELPAPAVLDALASVRAGVGGSGGQAGSVLFDPGPRAPALAAAGTLDAALSAADVLLLTEEEAAGVTGEVDPVAAARVLLARHGPRSGGAVTTVLVKRGPAGAVLVMEGDPTSYARTAPSITARDTVGCGDSFAAAVALARSVGASPEVTLALGNAVGAATALSPGAGRNVATPSDAAALLRRDAGSDRAAADALKLLAASLGAARVRRGLAKGGGGSV